MKKLLMSKLSFLYSPTFLISFFLIGLLYGSQQNYKTIIISLVVTLVCAICLIYRRRFAVIGVFLTLGILIGNYHNQAVSKEKIMVGCLEAQVQTTQKKFKLKSIYKMRSDQSFLLIGSEKFVVGDVVKVCLSEKVQLNLSDQRYLLSQFHLDRAYEAKEIEIIGASKSFRRSLNRLSLKFKNQSAKLFSSDQGVLAYGLIFGSSSDFSSEFKAALKRSGTSHIVAVSGYNVSIITSWLFDSLRTVGKNFAGIFSIFTLAGFYFMTGGSASVLRASVMGAIILLSKFIGRRVAPLHLLILAASIILLFNPYSIYDWGFQLSFMATAGLFFLSPLVERGLNFLKINSSLRKIFAETLSAQIFVLPLLISNFGSFSLIAPLTNLLILPLIPLIMLIVFITYLISFASPILGIFMGGIAKIVLSYIMLIISMSSRLPFAAINFKYSGVIFLTLSYVLIFVVVFILRRRFSDER